jgi:hypothetical protein
MLASNGTSYFRAFMMLKLLPYLAKCPTTTHTLNCMLTLLIFGNEFSFVAITRKRGS